MSTAISRLESARDELIEARRLAELFCWPKAERNRIDVLIAGICFTLQTRREQEIPKDYKPEAARAQ